MVNPNRHVSQLRDGPLHRKHLHPPVAGSSNPNDGESPHRGQYLGGRSGNGGGGEEQRLTAFATDNAANANSVFRDSIAVWVWLCSACHILNLVMKHAMDLNKDSVLKRLAAQIANTKALVILVRCKELYRHLDKSRKMEVETRWNSMLAMLSPVVDAIPQMTSSPAFQSADVAELVSGVNSKMLQRLVKLLSPLEETTNHPSGQEYPTIHLVAPTKEQLIRQLEVVIDDGTIRRLEEWLSPAVDAKFSVNDYHLMAALLWPLHRQLANFSKTTSEEQRRQGTSELVEPATELRDSSSSSAQQRTPPTPTEAGSSSSGSLAFFSFSTVDETASEASETTVAAAEVAEYPMDHGLVGGHITKDIIGYWSAAATRARLPVLCRASSCAASILSERTFSVPGRTLEERRSSLHPDSVDALVFLNSRGKAADQ